MIVRFTVPGPPQGKARPRFVKKTGIAYTPEKTVSYENLIAMAADKAMDGRALIEGAVHLVITATFPIPKSRQRAIAKMPIAWHLSKPDGDNILKAVGDGLNGIVWKDDKQIAFSKIQKLYGEKPGLDVMVEALA